MPIEICVEDDGKGVIWTGKGTLTGKELKDARDAGYACEAGIRRLEFILADLRAVTHFAADNVDMAALAEQDKKASNVNPDFIIAVVCAQDLPYGMSRMWEILLSDSFLGTLVCRTIEEARAWIEEQRQARFGQ